MKHAPSLFFLLCLCMLFYVSVRKSSATEPVVETTPLTHSEQSYQIDLTRGNWTLNDLDMFFPVKRFQILEVSDGMFWYSVLDRDSLKQQVIDTYRINGMEKEAWYKELHDIQLKYVTVVTEEENIKKLMRKYAWIEYL